MARIVTVYNDWRKPFELVEMGYIRWLKISEALARRGHQVDIATNEPCWHGLRWRRPSELRLGPNLRRIPLAAVRWHEYDMVKTLFHDGLVTLERYHGTDHPLIISKLGSVVGPHDMEGVPFYGRQRAQLYALQERIARTSTYVAVISPPARELWQECFGDKPQVLLVPGAADQEVPPPGHDPYPADGRPRCLFAGNIYFKHSQPEANVILVDKLNRLGKLLAERGIRLYLLGTGDVRRLDKRYVTYLGACPYEESWDYLHFADVGVVVTAARFLHNNESTKIYHYLRVGLPVVSEQGFPNDHVVGEAGLGEVVENGNLEAMAAAVQNAVEYPGAPDAAIRYILQHHTWDQRVSIYEDVLARNHTPGVEWVPPLEPA
jgi:glycosyltransferase involved in cell wall biosynthesis